MGATIGVRRDGCESPADHRLILTLLRGRIGGLTVEGAAAASGLPVADARDCLAAMRDDGLVCCEVEHVLWRYGTRTAELWS